MYFWSWRIRYNIYANPTRPATKDDRKADGNVKNDRSVTFGTLLRKQKQVTLVAPNSPVDSSIPQSARTVLDFQRDVITSTLITVRGSSNTRYKVETKTTAFSGLGVKLVISENDQTIVTVRHRDVAVFPDQITFAEEGSPSININKWLKWSKGSTFPVIFEESGQQFEWRVGGPTHLILHDQSTGAEIAWFRMSRSGPLDASDRPVRIPSYLALAPKADDMRKRVLVSCILVVRKARVNRQSTGAFAQNLHSTACVAVLGPAGAI